VRSELPYADLLTMIEGDPSTTASLYAEIGYKVIGRVDVDKIHNIGELLIIPRKVVREISLFRPSSGFLVAFRPSAKSDARRAGKVRRTSTLLFDHNNIDLCDEEQIEVMRRGSSAIEIVISALLDNKIMPRFLSKIIRCVRLAAKEGIDVVFSSGARDPAEIWAPGSIRILYALIDRQFINMAFGWVEVVRRWRPGLNLY
jgi:hypothetical protein